MCYKICIAYSDDYLRYYFGPTHPYKPLREKMFYEYLVKFNLINHPCIKIIKPEVVNENILKLVHTEEYIQFVKEMSEIGMGYLDYGDTPAFKGIYEAAAIRVDGTIKCVDYIMKGECNYGFNPGGGFHHARSNKAAGFCVFNDIVIAVRYLQKYYNVNRIAIFDMDVHHADGTQELLYKEPILKISTHMYTGYFYPGTGTFYEIGEDAGYGYSINIPLLPSSGDDIYQYLFDEIVIPILEKYEPEFIIVQIGCDSLEGDLLGALKLTSDSYIHAIEKLKEIAKKYSGNRMLLLGGGGYNFENTAKNWLLTIIKLCEINVPNELIEFLKVGSIPTTSIKEYWEYAQSLVRKMKSLLTMWFKD